MLRDSGGAELSLPTRKTRALLAYLAVNADKPQRRERLMTLLWGDRGDRQARQSLNQALRSIRRLGEVEGVQLLNSDGEKVVLRGDALETDIAQFQATAGEDPAKAAGIYAGPFLDNVSIAEPSFEEWQHATRSQLQDLACDALAKTAATATSSGDFKAAIELTKRLLSLDPLREDAHRRLMQILHESGDRAAALRQYQVCAEALKKELQVEPGVETRSLFEQIQKGPAVMTRPASPSAPATTPLPLPDKPSISVLPFENLSGDPEQEYYSDGITDDIITDLSKVSGLFVIARNSTFVYKNRAVDIKQVGRETGVRYILKGSIRRAKDKLRINAQLIDVESGAHLWSERYDGDLEDIFALQDQITENIVATLSVTLTRVEQNLAMRKETSSLRAYDYVLRGNAYHHRLNREDNVKATEMFLAAIEIDPRYAQAYAGLAWVLVHDANQGWANDFRQSLNEGLEHAKRAVVLDELLAKGHMVLGDAFLWTKQNDQAVEAGRQAIALEPSYADGHFALSVFLRYAGLVEESLEEAKNALRLNPLYGFHLYYLALSRAHYMLKDYEAALEAGKQAMSRGSVHIRQHTALASAYAQSGQTEAAKWHGHEIMKLNPRFSIRRHANFLPYKYQSDVEHYIDGLRKAGLPD